MRTLSRRVRLYASQAKVYVLPSSFSEIVLRLQVRSHCPPTRHGSAKRGARMSSHPARSSHRHLDPPATETSPPPVPGLGRSNSDATVLITLGVGIGVLLFLLVLPYLGGI